jgi:hypothetical protein
MSRPAIHFLQIGDETIQKNTRIQRKLLRTPNDVDYVVLNYSKEGMCFNDYKTGLYRSVICSYPENQILSFSPPKTILPKVFMQMYPDIQEDIFVREWIEGPLVHLFFDSRIDRWEIATKSFVGGGNRRKSASQSTTATFYKMVLDALRGNPGQQLHELPILENFDKSMSYQFILQHPENQIVFQVTRPMLYLISVYKTIHSADRDLGKTIHSADYSSGPTSGFVQHISPTIYENNPALSTIRGIIEFPRYFSFDTYDEIMNDKGIGGYVLVHGSSGHRTTIKNTEYHNHYSRKLLFADLQYLYLCIQRKGNAQDFLRYFSSYKREFFKIQEDYNHFVGRLHQCYLDTYIYGLLNPNAYSKYARRLHKEIYIPSLRTGKRKYISKKLVGEFLKTLDPRELLFALNISSIIIHD